MKSHRNIRYRLIPGTCSNAKALAQIAGACRHVWNHFLGENQKAYKLWKGGKGDKPSVSFFSLGKEFTQYRNSVDWLKELPQRPVRHVLKYQADAWQAAFKRGGFPKFKSRYTSPMSFTIPDQVVVKNGKLLIPTVGYMTIRRKGGNPYPDGIAKQVVVKRELGRWYATISYEVEIEEAEDDGTIIGVDMNCDNVALSTGDIIYSRRIERLEKLERNRRRHQRMVARRVKGSNRRERAKRDLSSISRRIGNIRDNLAHKTSRMIADRAYSVIAEKLDIKSMTEAGGEWKRNLNRRISEAGWGRILQRLDYKADRFVQVDPAYTSQRCSKCGHTARANRKTQSDFKCVRCGHASNADANAALNVLAAGIAVIRRGQGHKLSDEASQGMGLAPA